MIVTTTPKVSHNRPIATPPTANPLIPSGYGREASARVRPKSACTNGRATGIDHMPMLPMVPTATANPTRRHAVGESTSLSWRSRESMKLPSNQFQDADLACSAHVVNHVRHGYVRDG